MCLVIIIIMSAGMSSRCPSLWTATRPALSMMTPCCSDAPHSSVSSSPMSPTEGQHQRCRQSPTVNIIKLLITIDQGTELCNGDKPKDAFAPSQDCYDDAVHRELLEAWREDCRGRYDCVTSVPTRPLSPECDGKRREMRAEYICGELGIQIGLPGVCSQSLRT